MKLKKIDFKYVYDIKCTNKEEIFNLEKNKDREYILKNPTKISVYTDKGVLYVSTFPNFVFDGRSGGPVIDCYVPNLGSFDERLSWLVHDANAYAQCLDFKSTNKLLYLMLRDLCGYGKIKAKIVQTAVSITKSWFGVPKINDKYYWNQFKLSVWFTKNIK